MAAKIHQNAVAARGHKKRDNVVPVDLMHIKVKVPDIELPGPVGWPDFPIRSRGAGAPPGGRAQ